LGQIQFEEIKKVAKGSGFHVSGTVIGILAIIAGILILFNWLSLSLVIGVFLIVYGILYLIDRR
jgi:uncharacterized membrane protein HdeD (DUF308 family)